MELSSFKNKHAGEKIIVCGCGESITLLTEPGKFITLGVNDIGRLFCPNYLVVVNDRGGFEPSRWKWIDNTACPVVFTHLKGLPINNAAAKVIITLGKYGAVDLDKVPINYTSNSPYIGVILAYHLGATKIGLLGVDFTQNHFFAKTGNHPLAKKVNTISDEYIRLEQALAQKNVSLYNLSPNSLINIPKMHLNDFEKL